MQKKSLSIVWFMGVMMFVVLSIVVVIVMMEAKIAQRSELSRQIMSEDIYREDSKLEVRSTQPEPQPELPQKKLQLNKRVLADTP